MPIQYFLLVAIAVAAFIVWKRFREGVVGLREGLLWSLIWIGAAVVVLLPDTTSVLARFLGVGRGVDVVVYGGIVLLFFLVFKLFVHLDRLEAKMTDLVRQEALRGLDEKKGCCGGCAKKEDSPV